MDEDIIHLYINGELIETTAEHPFYTADGLWIKAADLEPGEMILSLDGDYGVVESVVVIEDANQPMFNLTVDDVHTFVVGDGDWVVHNDNCPRLLQIPDGELGTARYQVETLEEIPNIPGIYELIHLNRNELPYVGSSLTLMKRLRGRKYAGDIENYADIVFTPIFGASKTYIELAETIRILQVRAEFGDDIYNMANGWNDNLEMITRKLYPTNTGNVPKYFLNRDHLRNINSLMRNNTYPWPDWLRP